MNTSELKELLNGCRTPQFTRVSDLRPGIPYRIVQLSKAHTRYGETLSATLEGLVGDKAFLTVYLPIRYLAVLTEATMESYNQGEGERMFLQYCGLGKGVEFV